MKRTITRVSFAAIACCALSARPASAQDVTCTWEDPCDVGGFIGYRDCLFGFCRCSGAWWDTANWSCNSVPNASNEIAVIQETNDNAMCPEQASERWHEIYPDSVTFKKLEIKANGGSGLRLAFFGQGVGHTLTVNTTVRIDGINGPVTFEVGASAKLKTQ